MDLFFIIGFIIASVAGPALIVLLAELLTRLLIAAIAQPDPLRRRALRGTALVSLVVNLTVDALAFFAAPAVIDLPLSLTVARMFVILLAINAATAALIAIVAGRATSRA